MEPVNLDAMTRSGIFLVREEDEEEWDEADEANGENGDGSNDDDEGRDGIEREDGDNDNDDNDDNDDADDKDDRGRNDVEGMEDEGDATSEGNGVGDCHSDASTVCSPRAGESSIGPSIKIQLRFVSKHVRELESTNHIVVNWRPYCRWIFAFRRSSTPPPLRKCAHAQCKSTRRYKKETRNARSKERCA
jgi:hypothetical protein